MAKMTSTEEAHRAYFFKQLEYDEFEDNYRSQKRRREENYEELYGRYWSLMRLLEDEVTRYHSYLGYYAIEEPEMRDHFRRLEYLREEADLAYRQRRDELEEEEVEADQAYRRRCLQLEDEIEELRRIYAANL